MEPAARRILRPQARPAERSGHHLSIISQEEGQRTIGVHLEECELATDAAGCAHKQLSQIGAADSRWQPQRLPGGWQVAFVK